MKSLLGLFCCGCLVVLSQKNGVVVDASKEFKVGDDLGWLEPPPNNTAMYIQWAAKNRFLVGDSLSFEYQNDSVLVVEKFVYYHCNTSNPFSSFDNGKTVFKLDTPGPCYFICGAPNHCKNGPRLLVVMGPHPSGQAPAPQPSSGPSVSLASTSVSMAIILTFVTLARMAS
ncbi:mavicyanin-like [Tripterygium wilfordii]|uniref:mavicyanin-like n=1 Tax=Tripterygium wilfordii TaxID=458696 RepID=UPI0018F80962|nr:mavicyanin-like [Tripterygium wilfordii]